jgi:hypothetical protein
MAKDKKTKKGIRGPYLAAAVYCQTITTDPEGHATVTNIFDSIRLLIASNAPQNFPSEEERIPISVWTFISFKSGDAPGDHAFHMVFEFPGGKKEKREESDTSARRTTRFS